MIEKPTGNPKQWPLAIGFAIQEAIRTMKGMVPPELGLRIVMESAIPLASIPVLCPGGRSRANYRRTPAVNP